jgi:hypothetical protein
MPGAGNRLAGGAKGMCLRKAGSKDSAFRFLAWLDQSIQDRVRRYDFFAETVNASH